jgi:hypothetical protein
MVCTCDASAQRVKLKSLLNMRHGIVSYGLGGEDQGKAWLQRPIERANVKLEAPDTIDLQGSEVPVEGLVPMDRGNDEEQARIRMMDQ